MSDVKVLCVGAPQIVSINDMVSFPEEDSDTNLLGARREIKEGAATLCIALTSINMPCEFFGAIGSDEPARFLLETLQSAKVTVLQRAQGERGLTPITTRLLNTVTGSCTQLYFAGTVHPLNGVEFEECLSVSKHMWIHFHLESCDEEDGQAQLIDVVVAAQQDSGHTSTKVPTSGSFANVPIDGTDSLFHTARLDYIFFTEDSICRDHTSPDSMEESVCRLSEDRRCDGMIICRTNCGRVLLKERGKHLVVRYTSCKSQDQLIAETIQTISRGHSIQDSFQK